MTTHFNCDTIWIVDTTKEIFMEEKIISLVKPKEQEDYGICDWCGEPITNESDIYKVRGDYICRDCVERMHEERED